MTGSSKSLLIKLAVLAALVWLVYSNSLRHPFQFDDWHVIPKNPAVRGPSSIPRLFVDPTAFSVIPGNWDYRPLFLTAFALSWWAGGGSTVPFHLTSVALHMVSVLLLFLILRIVLADVRNPCRRWLSSHLEWTAFFAAALFGLHPVTTQSVNYISAQSVPMAAGFYLLAFLLFLLVYARREPISRLRMVALVAASCLCYFLAMLAKPIGITLPLNLLLWELLLGRTPWDEGSRPAWWRRWWIRLRKLIPYGVAAAAYLWLRVLLLEKAFVTVTKPRPRLHHYLTETKALLFFYLRKALLPDDLNVDPEIPLSTSPLEPKVLLSFLAVALFATALVLIRRQRVLVFWSLWFPVCLLVTTYGVVLYQMVNEHRVYLSLAGLVTVLCLLSHRLAHALPERVAGRHLGDAFWSRVLAAGGVLVLVVFAVGTRTRNQAWASELTLWEDAVQSEHANWRAHMNYALALENEGRRDEALPHFEKAVEKQSIAFTHMNLGLAYVRRQRLDEGLMHLERAVQLWPALPEAHYYLAYGLQQKGEPDAAERSYQQAISLRPDYSQAHRDLAALHESQGRGAEAIEVYEKLQRIDPSQTWVAGKIQRLRQKGYAPRSPLQRASAELAMKDYRAAIEILEPLYNEKATDPDLLFRLAFAHQMEGGRDRAIALYEQLLAVAPKHAQGLFNLAYAYLHGDSGEQELRRSTELFLRTLELEPDYHEVLHHLASAYWMLGDEANARRYDRLFVERGSDEGMRQKSRDRLGEAGRE